MAGTGVEGWAITHDHTNSSLGMAEWEGVFRYKGQNFTWGLINGGLGIDLLGVTSEEERAEDLEWMKQNTPTALEEGRISPAREWAMEILRHDFDDRTPVGDDLFGQPLYEKDSVPTITPETIPWREVITALDQNLAEYEAGTFEGYDEDW